MAGNPLGDLDPLLAALFQPRTYKPSLLDEVAMRAADIRNVPVATPGGRPGTESNMTTNTEHLRERLARIDEEQDRARERKRREELDEHERLERERKRLEERIALLEGYGDDIWPTDTVMSFVKNFAATPGVRNSRSGSYSYAVIKCEDGNWYMTGSAHKDAMSWEELTTFLSNSPVVSFEDVYVAGMWMTAPDAPDELDDDAPASSPAPFYRIPAHDFARLRIVSRVSPGRGAGNSDPSRRRYVVEWPEGWAKPVAPGTVEITLRPR